MGGRNLTEGPSFIASTGRAHTESKSMAPDDSGRSLEIAGDMMSEFFFFHLAFLAS